MNFLALRASCDPSGHRPPPATDLLRRSNHQALRAWSLAFGQGPQRPFRPLWGQGPTAPVEALHRRVYPRALWALGIPAGSASWISGPSGRYPRALQTLGAAGL
eukprot:NODE_5482_length_702_cov_9.877489_g4623_i0.p2 GENE.NODE_5482_length_702_cov_9.877489_g4623_i0~~NODE_5482_length_702_cov_9.877489_g4623_i0.p2  ORF type:complete len:104 (+),score=1.21 NODE_5482_length_702_cov_9.877489_g4623_i0:130-441(+)